VTCKCASLEWPVSVKSYAGRSKTTDSKGARTLVTLKRDSFLLVARGGDGRRHRARGRANASGRWEVWKVGRAGEGESDGRDGRRLEERGRRRTHARRNEGHQQRDARPPRASPVQAARSTCLFPPPSLPLSRTTVERNRSMYRLELRCSLRPASRPSSLLGAPYQQC
jgi:hypothetical protein